MRPIQFLALSSLGLPGSFGLLGLLALLGVSPASLAAQDQLVRPAGVSLAPAIEPNAAPEFSPRPAGDSLSVPLKRDSGERRESVRSGLFGGPVATITGGLAITLGLFAIVVVLARRGGGVNLRGLPREAFEVIGQASIGPRQRLLVVRIGTQAMVIGTSPAGIHRVAQIEDPDEAGQLIAQCRGMGAQAAFKSTLYELERQPTAPGFVDTPPAKTGNLFLRA